MGKINRLEELKKVQKQTVGAYWNLGYNLKRGKFFLTLPNKYRNFYGDSVDEVVQGAIDFIKENRRLSKSDDKTAKIYTLKTN